MKRESLRAPNVTEAHRQACGGSRSILPQRQWQRLADSLALSGRELQVLQSIFDDLTEAAIARELGISSHTVHTHLERLYRKLAVNSRGTLLVRVFAEHLSLEAESRGDAQAPRQT